MYTNNFPLDIIDVEVQNQTRMGGSVGRWVAGLADNITNSAPNLRLSSLQLYNYIQNYSSIMFVEILTHLGHSASFLLYWVIHEVEIRFKSIMETYLCIPTTFL